MRILPSRNSTTSYRWTAETFESSLSQKRFSLNLNSCCIGTRYFDIMCPAIVVFVDYHGFSKVSLIPHLWHRGPISPLGVCASSMCSCGMGLTCFGVREEVFECGVSPIDFRWFIAQCQQIQCTSHDSDTSGRGRLETVAKQALHFYLQSHQELQQLHA